MKKSLINKIVKPHGSNAPALRRFLPALFIILLFSGMAVKAQLPIVSVQFTNPQYDCPTQTYCLDVEFRSETQGDTLFGMNLRFFYDDNILEYLGTSEFKQGYDMPEPPVIETGDGGEYFGFAGPLEWFNGYIVLKSETNIELPTNGWVKLFKICFHVDDPNSTNIENFCPTIVWDLQEDPPEIGGGFLWGDDGVVMTLVNTAGQLESSPTTEVVVQFNWEYGGNPIPGGFGFPISIVCISTICDYVIPISNWSLFLAIGMMVIATLFIYRRRYNS